jgi:hypothetical protein
MRNVSDRSIGVDLGMTLVKNVWISIGYNLAGFRDDVFKASRSRARPLRQVPNESGSGDVQGSDPRDFASLVISITHHSTLPL